MDFVVSCCFSLRGAFWHTAVHTYNALFMDLQLQYTSVLLFMFHLSLLTLKGIDLVHVMALSAQWILSKFFTETTYFDYRGSFRKFFD